MLNPESHAAHAQVQPTKRESYARVLAHAQLCGLRGLTADEVAVAFVCSHNHVAPRIGELVRAGELIPTGERRRTRSGCFAQVLVAKQFAYPAPTQPELALTGVETLRYPG